MTAPAAFSSLRHDARLREMASDPTYALEIGRAAEHLVVADLIIQGHKAFLTDQGMPYDIVVDAQGKLIRVQVKACCFARNCNASGRRERLAYQWAVRYRGKDRRGERLSDKHCDIVALVALDNRVVAYVPLRACSQTVTMAISVEAGRFGVTMNELASFSGAVAGHPRSLATNGRRAAITRAGQLTLVAGGLDG